MGDYAGAHLLAKLSWSTKVLGLNSSPSAWGLHVLCLCFCGFSLSSLASSYGPKTWLLIVSCDGLTTCLGCTPPASCNPRMENAWKDVINVRVYFFKSTWRKNYGIKNYRVNPNQHFTAPPLAAGIWHGTWLKKNNTLLIRMKHPSIAAKISAFQPGLLPPQA